MKKLLLLILWGLSTSISFSQLNVFNRYTPESGDNLIVVNYFGQRQLSEKFSLTYSGLVNETFAEALVGVSYQPSDWISIGFSAGVEKDNGFRTGQSLILSDGKHLFLLFTEFGEGRRNYFYRGIYNYKINEKITVGANGWRFHGFGPHFTYDLGDKLKAKIWISPLYDFEFELTRVVIGTTIKI